METNRIVMSQTATETGTTPLVAKETTLQEVEAGLNIAAEVAEAAAPVIGGAVGGPAGAAIGADIAEGSALLPTAETAVNTVVAAAPHQTALTDISNAVAAAAPVIAAAPLNAATQAKVSGGLSLIGQILEDIKSWF